MYKPEFYCDNCKRIVQIWEAVTWKGLCPYDGHVLILEFKTVGYKTNA